MVLQHTVVFPMFFSLDIVALHMVTQSAMSSAPASLLSCVLPVDTHCLLICCYNKTEKQKINTHTNVHRLLLGSPYFYNYFLSNVRVDHGLAAQL